MTNHVHLLVTPAKEDSLSKLFQSAGRRYVQYFNFSYKRSGTLWEGRYRASLIDAENYLLTCMRYIELNPVRQKRRITHPATPIPVTTPTRKAEWIPLSPHIQSTGV